MVVYEALVKRNFSNVAVICFITVISALASDGLLNERIVILGIPSAIFVSLMLVLLRDRELPRVFLVLGGASYSLYLTHPYVIQVFDKITRWFSGGRFEQAFALIISLALVNLLAVATYVYLERPTRNWLREKFI
jgi:peptidoglycan/LPS O-acetylase OafA/YrhL